MKFTSLTTLQQSFRYKMTGFLNVISNVNVTFIVLAVNIYLLKNDSKLYNIPSFYIKYLKRLINYEK